MPHCSKVFILVKRSVLTRLRLNSSDNDVYKGSPNKSSSDHIRRMITNINYHALPGPHQTTRESRLSIGRHWITDLQRRRSLAAARTFPDVARHSQCCHSKILTTLRFDRMRSRKMRGREFTLWWNHGRKGSQRKQLQRVHRRGK